MKMPPKELLDFFEKHDNFIVAGHAEPDADCICSSIVLASILSKWGKNAIAYNEGPFFRDNIKFLKKQLACEIDSNISEKNQPFTLIIVDCSTPNRVGKFAENCDELSTAVIDHHASGESFGNLCYIDKECPSTTLLIYRIARSLNIELSKDEAFQLLYGFCTDTGYFKHLTCKKNQEVKEVSELMKLGANPKECYSRMHGGKSLNSKLLMGRVLSRIELHNEGKVILTYDTEEDIYDLGEKARDADALYDQLFSIQNVDVVIYIKYKDDQLFSIGLRSLKATNVGEIAKEFGGGGHKLAAGLKYKGDFTVLKSTLLEKIINPKYFI